MINIGPTLRIWDGYPHTSGHLQPEVRRAQTALREAGRAVSVDGYFGPRTQDAVEAFQGAHGLRSDGIVGPSTWAALLALAAPDREYFDTRYVAGNITLRVQLRASKAYHAEIAKGARAAGVDEAVVWGIGSRESGWGSALRPPTPAGTGDFIRRATMRAWRTGPLPPDGGGYGRGLMQIDFDAHEFARTGPWTDAAQNIAYGCSVLRDNLTYAARKWTQLNREAALRAAVASYNCGAGNVNRAIQQGRPVDYYTHGRDYSADVLERAGWYQRNAESGEL
jgi:peptidoglycan hydrolase-like protein with peptidoglycan-binding domain